MNHSRNVRAASTLMLASTMAQAAATLAYPGLGTVAIERPTGAPTQVVIFLSGDGGWNKGVVDMARHLTEQGALVAGVDVTAMQRQADADPQRCVSAAALLEGLSHFVQQQAGLRQYLPPILVGYSSGATVAYATLAQAPPGTFRGALSLGFCPDLEWQAPLCRGEGLEPDRAAGNKGFVYRAAQHLQEPWFALQGEQDQVCAAEQTRQFVAGVPHAEVGLLPKVGHGYSVEKNWLPQFLDAHRKLAAGPPAPAPLSREVSDLPLIELRGSASGSDVLAVMLSGDGGWAGLDKQVAAQLNAEGVPVVGWDSLRYFWDARAPGGAARDLDRVIRHYLQAWHKSRVLLIGYSQGADTLPLMVNRLPEASRRPVAAVALLNVSDQAFFEFHVSHWLGAPTGGMPTAPELADPRLRPLVCIYGKDETDSPCHALADSRVRKIALPGGHHFDGDYASVARAILATAVPK